MWYSSVIYFRTTVISHLGYINDLPCVLKFAPAILFGNDSNFYDASHNNLNILYNEINKDLENLVTWFKAIDCWKESNRKTVTDTK